MEAFTVEYRNKIERAYSIVSGDATQSNATFAELIPAPGMAVMLSSTYQSTRRGNEGIFIWREGNYASLVSADTYGAIYIGSNRVPSSQGAWVRFHDRGLVEANWWSQWFTYDSSIGSPVDIGAALQAALNYAAIANVNAGYEAGGIVKLPKGYGYFTTQLIIPNGVFLEGHGIESSGLAFNGGDSVDDAIWIGSTDHSASFSCGLRDLQIKCLETPANADTGATVVYTESAQHDSGLIRVKIMGGGRTCFECDTGWGGATYLSLKDLETHSAAGFGGAPDNPQVLLNYPSSFLEIFNLVNQGSSGGSSVARGTLIKSGYVHIYGYHNEYVTDGVIVDQADSPHHAAIWDAVGGSGVTNVISSAATDRAGRHLIYGRALRNGATNIYKDNRASGSTVAVDEVFQNSDMDVQQALVEQLTGFSSDTYITSSALQVSHEIRVGTVFEWEFEAEKTAAGTATPVYTVRVGTNASTADTARLTLTGAAQTAAADKAKIKITVTVRSISATGVIRGHVHLQHNLAATGFANTPAGFDLVGGTSAAFDNTALAGKYVGLSINAGASAAWTIEQLTARIIY